MELKFYSILEGMYLTSRLSISAARFMQMYALYIYFYNISCTFCE